VSRKGVPDSPETRERKRQAALRRSPEHYAKVSAALKGYQWSDEQKAAMRTAAQRPERRAKISRALQGHPVSTKTRAAVAAQNRARYDGGWVNRHWSGTQPEQLMAAILEWAGVDFIGQHRIGRYVVDFYLPDTRAVIEVDGTYWHPDGPNPERDAALVAAGASVVHHITDERLAARGWA
jgi:hypothetical protein